MKFWDSSALVPLVVYQKNSGLSQSLMLGHGAGVFVWWGTVVECFSAIQRLERENLLSAKESVQAANNIKTLSKSWHEILPSDAVREKALRLIRVHSLRSADSFQLAAALTASGDLKIPSEFISFDNRLNAAASREGFAVCEEFE